MSQSLEFFEVIGKGSSGLVQKAILKKKQEYVAVKSIQFFEKEKRKQLLNDIKFLTNLTDISGNDGYNSPFLVDFHGAYLDESKSPLIIKDSVKVVLELMDRGSLRDLDKRAKNTNIKFSEPVLAAMSFQILGGLAYLHNVVRQAHLDIKPENILLNSSGVIKITDFGISKCFEETRDMMDTFVGTFRYMSPERIKSQKYNCISDIWSFGLCIAELALGTFPIKNTKSFIDVFNYLNSDEDFKFDSGECFSDEFKDFVELALKKNPLKRPSSIELMVKKFKISRILGCFLIWIN